MMQTGGQRSLIPWIFVAAMGVVVAVNAGMVTLAVTSFSGLAHADAFNRGVAYNRILAEVERQEQVGWTWRVALAAKGGAPETLQVALTDAAGRPLAGARIEAVLRRPVERLAAIPLELREVATGVYAATVDLPRRDQWDVKLAIVRGSDNVEGINRIFAP